MSRSEFWEDAATAQIATRQASQLKACLEPYRQLERRLGDVAALLPEALLIQDTELTDSLIKELALVAPELEQLELRRLLSDPLDDKNCFLTINAGAGGTESCDWVDILARMYARWANRRNWEVQLVDRVEGEVAGSKSITYSFKGPLAFGYARVESGVHRLVRISPFDAQQRRHTSFASVDVTPEVEGEVEVELKSDELRIDTYRASGAGGQHVNKTDSAVRITYLADGTSVSCQSQRSQLQNKETCMRLLKAKIFAKRRAQKEQELKALAPDKREITWGSQIRSYVLQPYTMIKDARTRFETGNAQAVLDGDLDPFVVAYLKLTKAGESAT